MLLVIYITNLYRRKISTFFLSKDEILVKKTPTSLHEKKTVCRQWTLILIFCVDVHMGLDPPPPSTCIHLSLIPLPLCVDVINGWPLSVYKHFSGAEEVCINTSPAPERCINTFQASPAPEKYLDRLLRHRWDMVAHWLRRLLSTGGSWVRLPL